jgi:hypothetical protein
MKTLVGIRLAIATYADLGQCTPRGPDKVKGEWSQVTLAWNVGRMFALRRAERKARDPSLAKGPDTMNASHPNPPCAPHTDPSPAGC